MPFAICHLLLVDFCFCGLFRHSSQCTLRHTHTLTFMSTRAQYKLPRAWTVAPGWRSGFAPKMSAKQIRTHAEINYVKHVHLHRILQQTLTSREKTIYKFLWIQKPMVCHRVYYRPSPGPRGLHREYCPLSIPLQTLGPREALNLWGTK